ncbi:hypothetical protein [Tuwongella immobilis]|nr:hypothetical protein [Tuwongella immobilis]
MRVLSQLPVDRFQQGFVLLTLVDERYVRRSTTNYFTPNTLAYGLQAGVLDDLLAAGKASFVCYRYSGERLFVPWASANQAAGSVLPLYFAGGELGGQAERLRRIPTTARMLFPLVTIEDGTSPPRVLPDPYAWLTQQGMRGGDFLFPVGYSVNMRREGTQVSIIGANASSTNSNPPSGSGLINTPISSEDGLVLHGLMPAIFRDKIIFRLRDAAAMEVVLNPGNNPLDFRDQVNLARYERKRVSPNPDNREDLQKIAVDLYRNYIESQLLIHQGLVMGFHVLPPEMGHDLMYRFRPDNVTVSITKHPGQYQPTINLERGTSSPFSTLFPGGGFPGAFPDFTQSPAPQDYAPGGFYNWWIDSNGQIRYVNEPPGLDFAPAHPGLGLFASIYSIPGRCIIPGTLERFHLSTRAWNELLTTLSTGLQGSLVGRLTPDMLAPDEDWSALSNRTVFQYPADGIDGSRIRPGTIPWGDSPNGSIPTSKISGLNGYIIALIQSDGLTNWMIRDDSITAAKIAAGSVTNTKLANNAVTAVKIADGTITLDKLHESIRADLPIRAIEVTPNSVTTSGLADEAVTAAKLAAGAVTTPKLANGSVTVEKLAPGVLSTPGANSVGTLQLQDDSITAAKLQAASVTTEKLDTGSVTNSKIAAGAVGAAQLGAAAVTDFALAANAVTEPKLADGAVSAAKIAAGAAFKVGDILRGETF